jgi:hypothetical protein
MKKTVAAAVQTLLCNTIASLRLSLLSIISTNGKNPWFPQGCKSQCSHTLKTANIKFVTILVAYSSIIRLIIVLSEALYHTQMLLQASILSNYFHVSAQLQPMHVYCSLKWIAMKKIITQLY